jgi:Putative transposase/Transposase zinc-binding domain
VSGELGAILRASIDEHVATHRVPAEQQRILRALAQCGTGELGYAEYECRVCGVPELIPRGCGNRHCPRCQGRLARAWLERQQADLLDTTYFHTVFTLPHVLLPLCVARPVELYRLLFDAAAQTLLRLGRERLGGTVGLSMVLHTWGQPLNLHPHVHAIVTGGALDAAGRWHPGKRRGYLFPVGVMSAIFRGKFMEGLTALKEAGTLPSPPGGWPKLWKTLEQSKWVVYCKRPFAGPEQVLAYLANYTHRVAISERRLVAFDETARTVTFRWRDYRLKGAAAVKLQTLPVDEFLRRFRRHLLPRGFTKVRHYGLLANNARRTLIPKARAALAAASGPKKRPPPAKPTASSAPAWPPPCAHCGATHVRCVALIRPDGRRVRLQPPRCDREPP